MSKRLMKTIVLIVFVVFFGMKNVHAGVFKTCLYTSGSKSVSMTINDSFKNAKVSESSFGDFKGVVNWEKYIKNATGKEFGQVATFLGQKFFLDNGKKCPPIAIAVQYTANRYLYLSDNNSKQSILSDAEKMRGSVFGWKPGTYEVTEMSLAQEIQGDDYYDDGSNDNSNSQVTAKTCKCSGKSNGVRVSVKFKVTPNLVEPRPTIVWNGNNNDENISNWSNPLESSTYTYLQHLAKSDSCPDYAIVGHDVQYKLAVSDSANKSSVEQGMHDRGYSNVYTVACEQQTQSEESEPEKPTTPSNPEYVDPGVEPGVIGNLHTSIDTYSCGDNFITGIPSKLISTTRFIYNFIQVLVPVVLVILGILDLVKAIAGQKEDEIKKGQQIFIKRVIAAIVVFFVFAIVKLAISLINVGSQPIIECVECFLSSDSSCILE